MKNGKDQTLIGRTILRIKIFKECDNYGLIVDVTHFMRTDYIEVIIEGTQCGILSVGSRNYQINNGRVCFPCYELLLGTNEVTVTADNGKLYKCGSLRRDGRMLSAINPTEELIVCCTETCERLLKELASVNERIKKIEESYGIHVV